MNKTNEIFPGRYLTDDLKVEWEFMPDSERKLHYEISDECVVDLSIRYNNHSLDFIAALPYIALLNNRNIDNEFKGWYEYLTTQYDAAYMLSKNITKVIYNGKYIHPNKDATSFYAGIYRRNVTKCVLAIEQIINASKYNYVAIVLDTIDVINILKRICIEYYDNKQCLVEEKSE